ncbi:glycosyltransferase family 2 protein [Peribacillus butanolivorans]|uniref:glycosyltransferase family 2 protein n=1 Tax=Peribacillus butanolivorans TaxID=421767 RepID=UPI0036BCC29F
MNPILSIIVPIYNVEKYLPQCIESILTQTFTDYELILVDDGSPDKCSDICEEYAIKDSRIKVIHKTNGGLVSARKAGLEIAVGQYVGFVDSDDWIEPNMYEELYKGIQTGAEIVICDFYISYPDKEEVLSHDNPGFHNKESLINNIYPTMLYKDGYYNFGIMPAVWNKIFKRELLLKHLLNVDNRITIGEDLACSFPCMLDTKAIYILNDSPLYHYRKSNTSMTKIYKSNFFELNMVLFNSLQKSFERQGYELIVGQLQYYIVYLTLSALTNEMNDSSKKSLLEKTLYIHKCTSISLIKDAIKDIDLKCFPKRYRIYVNAIRFNLTGLLVFKWWIQKRTSKLLNNLNRKKLFS